MERYITTVEPPVLSMDYYPYGRGPALDDSLMWCDLALLKFMAKKYRMPLWFYYQGKNYKKIPIFLFSMVRLAMNVGALYGSKGLQHYTVWGSVVNPEDGTRGEFFQEQRAMHAIYREWGNTLMALECRCVIHDESLTSVKTYAAEYGETMADSQLLRGELPYHISVSELDDAYGNRYLLVLNRDYEEGRQVTLRLKSKCHLFEVSKETGKQILLTEGTDSLTCTLEPGQMNFYRLQDADEAPYTVEYQLNKS